MSNNKPPLSHLELSEMMGFVQAKLSQSDKQNVQSHLEDCAYCRDRVEDLQLFYQPDEVVEGSFEKHQKGLRQQIYHLTWKAYLQATWSRKRQELGLLFKKSLIPRHSFAILTILLGVFLWFNFTDFPKEVVEEPQAILVEQPKSSTNHDWKKIEGKYGLGLDYDFLYEKTLGNTKVIREGRFYMILFS